MEGYVRFAGRQSPVTVVLMGALLVGLVTAVPVYAEPLSADTSAAITEKRAERAAALAALEAMRAAFNQQMTQYAQLTKQIADTGAEVESVRGQIDVADAELLKAQDEFSERAAQLYRGDQVSMISLLLDARSIQDFMVRADYLLKLTSHDVTLIRDVRLARNESAFLHESLQQRLDQLNVLEQQAYLQQTQLEDAMVVQQRRAKELGTDIAQLIREQRAREAEAARQAATRSSGSSYTAGYSPDTLISDAKFRDSRSMDAAAIQAFLNNQPGVLKSYVSTDHSGRARTAAQMIAEAAVAYDISPKVILATLQKEQSLIEKSNPQQKNLDWAMGAGATDSGRLNGYAGFGNQVWAGARILDKNTRSYRTGAQRTIDGTLISPTNAATWSLYKYTPHMNGNLSFYMIYMRYFGDPVAP